MCGALVSANGLKNEIYRNNRRIVPSRKIGESEESYLKTHFLLFSELTIIAPIWRAVRLWLTIIAPIWRVKN